MNCNKKCKWSLKKQAYESNESNEQVCSECLTENTAFKNYGTEAKVKNTIRQGFAMGMIDAQDGAQRFELPLITLHGGYQLTFNISYDSSQTEKGTMGIGWSHCFERTLLQEDDEAYLYERPGIYQYYRRWEHDTLFWGRSVGYWGYQLFESNDGYRLERNNVSTEYYDYRGNLIKIKDRNGREIRLSKREGQTVITDLQTNKNLYLDFDEFEKLIQLSDGHERTVKFIYENDLLTEIIEINGNHRFYVYDEKGHMVSEYNNDHVCLYTNTYDKEGRIIRRKDGKGRSITLSYNEKERMITDRNRNKTHLTFNAQGLLSKYEDAEGNCYSYTYSPNGKLESITDPLGNTERMEYLGHYKLWRYTDKNGNRTEFSYDRDCISKITYPDGSIETFSWNNKNLLVEHCDLRGTKTIFSYDEHKNLIGKKVGKKKTVRYEYEDGLLIGETNTKGQTIRYKYNEYGQMICKIDAAGRPTNYEYDLSDQLLKITDPIGSSQSYTYNCNRLLSSFIDAKGNTTLYFYDENKNLKKILFADNTELIMEYDSEDHLIKKLDQEKAETIYRYDSLGRLIYSQQSDGNSVQYQYDALGRLCKKVSDHEEIAYTYDAIGNLLTETNNGNKTTYQYDSYSRIIREVNPFGGATYYSYSPAGDLLKKTDPFGNQTVYAYDAYGNQTCVCDPRGNVTRFIYDSNNNVLATVDPLGNTVHYEYDRYNRVIKRTNERNHREQYLYDAVGRFIGMTDAKENFINIFYDLAGNLRTFRDARRNELFTIQYDAMNRPESYIDVFGNKTNYQYDKTGKLKATIDPLGNLHPVQPTAKVTLPENRKVFYDLLGRIVAYENEDDCVCITYDEAGNIKTVADKWGISYREYDALNRLTRYTAANGQTIGYRYDPVGNVSAIVYPDQTEVIYSYDANNNLVSVTDWAGRNTFYLYDANNRVIGISKPNGQVVSFVYDEAGRIIEKEIGCENDKTHFLISYEYDTLGRIQKEITQGKIKYYTYDEQSGIVKITTMDQNDKSCETKIIVNDGESILYDQNGNIQNATIDGTEWNFQYDHSNRLILANEEKFFYDSENRCTCIQTDKTQKEIVYDLKNGEKPLMVTVNGVKSKLVYGLGLIGMETADQFYTYLFDQEGNTTHIINEKEEDVLCELSQTETPLALFSKKSFYGYLTVSNGIYFKNARFHSDDFAKSLNPHLLPHLF